VFELKKTEKSLKIVADNAEKYKPERKKTDPPACRPGLFGLKQPLTARKFQNNNHQRPARDNFSLSDRIIPDGALTEKHSA
jgi:hypothetical protein